MKANTTQTAKFRLTVRKLRPLLSGLPIEPETIVVGILERLWNVTASSAPRGDIGRFDDELIAEMVGWYGDAQVLIQTLIECGWIDPHPEYRLVIHDWKDHAPQYVRGNVTRMGGFIEGPSPEDHPIGPSYRTVLKEAPGNGSVSGGNSSDSAVESCDSASSDCERDSGKDPPIGPAPEDPPIGPSYSTGLYDRPKPSLVKSSLVKSIKENIEENIEKNTKNKKRARASPPQVVIPDPLNVPEFRKAWSEWQQHRKDIRKPLTPASIQQQLTRLAEWGPERAIAAIRYTIAQGWLGIREEEQPRNGKYQHDRAAYVYDPARPVEPL